ncbi:MAG: pyridoxal kinase PdxY [Alphaproteobacteria bacterium]|nr:pyridoxal kinase PdxY [Alphaproteobacteria bacterium]
MNILSIQSHVAFGHVGNSAATLPLQRLGFEVLAVPTVVWSNHAGYGDRGGPTLGPADVAAVIDGLERRGALAATGGVLTGYLGDAGLGPVLLDAVARVREANPAALWCCDPVLGDDYAGLYVDAAVAEFVASRALPAADIVTPNVFELELLGGRAQGSLAGAPVADIVGAARGLLGRSAGGRPGLAVVTSIAAAGMRPDSIAMLAVTADAAWLVVTPRLAFERPPNGAGDLTSALFLAQRLLHPAEPPGTSLASTAARVFAILAATHAAGARELALVAAQDALLRPPRAFAARGLRT